MSDFSYIEEGEQGEFPSLEDLNRYLAGEMSPEELQALESRMVDDPMFADVIEGLSQVADSKRMNQSISRIKAQSKTRLLEGIDDRADKRELTHKRKSRVKPRNFSQLALSIAAGIALLLVSVWLVRELNYVASSKGDAMAQQQIPTQQEEAITSAEQPQEEETLVLEKEEVPLNELIGNDDESSSSPSTSSLREVPAAVSATPGISARSVQVQPSDRESISKDEPVEQKPISTSSAPQVENSTPTAEPESIASGVPAPSAPKPAEQDEVNDEVLPPVIADTLQAEPYYTTEELETIQEHRMEEDDAVLMNSVPLKEGRKRTKSKKARQQAVADKARAKESDVSYSNLPRMTEEEQQKAQVGKASVIADLLEEASQLYDNSEHKNAIVKLDEVLISSPDNESAQYMMGLNYLAMNDASKAIQYFKPILNNPQSKVYHDSKWQLIQSYLSVNKVRSAKKLLESLIDSPNVYSKQATLQLDSLNQ